MALRILRTLLLATCAAFAAGACGEAACPVEDDVGLLQLPAAAAAAASAAESPPLQQTQQHQLPIKAAPKIDATVTIDPASPGGDGEGAHLELPTGSGDKVNKHVSLKDGGLDIDATVNVVFNVKSSEKGEESEESKDGALTSAPTPAPPPCPYDFSNPQCKGANVQSPRDLTTGAVGHKVPKAATLNRAQASFLPQTNMHYHLGAEHKSDAYNDDTDSIAYDAASHSPSLIQGGGSVRPGFMCPTSDVAPENLTEYKFQYCTGGVEVGKSYEIHYVHSSAGYSAEEADSASIDALDDGLGGAANGRGLLNPMVVVNAQIFQIVQGAKSYEDMLHGWTDMGHSNAVMYPGSTTGASFDNEVCSPYSITWHVDLMCHRVSPEAFDRLCQQAQEEYHMVSDLAPHGSRKLVDPQWVVKEEFVLPLA